MSGHQILGIVGMLLITNTAISQTKADSLHPAKPAESNFKQYSFKKPVIVSGSLIGLGLIALSENEFLSNKEYEEERNEHFSSFQTSSDDYLQYAPIAAVYGLNIAGVKGKNNFRNRTALLVKSELLTAVVVWSLKYTTKEERPDGSNRNSFPSGHTAQAFTAATFMSKEYGDLSPWYSIGAYGVATSVGALRILNNKHYVSDVLVGAGIGILTTNLVYATHQYKWGSRTNVSIQVAPTYDQGKFGFYGNVRF